MKATGVVRNVDNLGRVVLPKEIRRTLRIGVNDPVEFYTDGKGIYIKKYDTAGCAMQMLDNMERSIRLSETLMHQTTVDALLGKVQEMRIIVLKEE